MRLGSGRLLAIVTVGAVLVAGAGFGWWTLRGPDVGPLPAVGWAAIEDTPAFALSNGEPSQAIARATDVRWLEQMADLPDDDIGSRRFQKIYPSDGSRDGPEDYRILRADAYARLGALGTPESVAAVRRIEAEARRATPMTPTIPRRGWPNTRPVDIPAEIEHVRGSASLGGWGVCLVVPALRRRVDPRGVAALVAVAGPG